MIPGPMIPKRPLLWMAAVVAIAVTGLGIPKALAGSAVGRSGETKVARNAQRAPSVEFTADFVFGSQSRKFYQRGGKTRQDFGHMSTVKRVDKVKRSVNILVIHVKTKTYTESVTDAPDYMIDQGKWFERNWTRTGADRIEGYDCIKYTSPDSNVTCWFCKKLNLMIKEVDKGPGGRILQYRNIRERPVPDSVFDVPAGYRKVIPRN